MSFGPQNLFPVEPPGRRRTPQSSRLLLAGGVVAGILVAGALLDPFAIVSSGYVGVKTEFGAIQPDLLQPGLHFIVPFVAAVNEVSVQPHTSSTDEVSATHDQQNVTTTTAVTWAVDKNYADQVFRDFRGAEGLETTIIAPIVSNDVKAVVARYEAQALITERSKVAGEISALIGADLARYHARVSVGGVNLTNMQFSGQYDQAIEEKQIAQQQALKARYTLEQIQTSAPGARHRVAGAGGCAGLSGQAGGAQPGAAAAHGAAEMERGIAVLHGRAGADPVPGDRRQVVFSAVGRAQPGRVARRRRDAGALVLAVSCRSRKSTGRRSAAFAARQGE